MAQEEGNRADTPDLTEEEITGGERFVCPMRWTKGGIEALHEGTEAYMTGLIEDANLLVIHAHHYTEQLWDIQLARRTRGEPKRDISDYTV